MIIKNRGAHGNSSLILSTLVLLSEKPHFKPQAKWWEYVTTVSFDNLAVKQLNVKNLMSEEEYKEFFLGEDGFATMYIDMVKKEFARCSTATVRYPLKDDIKPMFEVIHNEITDCFTRKPTA